MLVKTLLDGEEQEKERKKKKKKENLIETSAVCSTMMERVLCAFFLA